jgi:hypothetical protein
MNSLCSLRAPNIFPWTILRICRQTVLGTFCISNMAAHQFTTIKRGRNSENQETTGHALYEDAHQVGRVHTVGFRVGFKVGSSEGSAHD